MASQSREYLSQLRKLDNEINYKCSRIEEMKARAAGIGSPGVHSDRVQVSRGAGIMSDLIDRAVDQEKEVQELISQYILLRDQIINLIHALDDPRYIEFLYLRYIGVPDKRTGKRVYLTIKEIEHTMRRSDGSPYTEKHVCRIHSDALKALDAILQDRPV